MVGRVSVVIPTYNRASLLKETIDSVIRQTVQVNEIIVVDDGSTDSTHDLVRSYGPPVVLLIQDHAREAVARNRGIEYASSEWVALLDSDDIWEPTKIEKQLQYLDKHPECGFVHTAIYLFGACDEVVQQPHFLEGNYKVEDLLFGRPAWICISSALVRKGTPITFCEWAEGCSDIIFFAELIRAGISLGYVNQPLVGYRVHVGSMNSEAKAQSRGASSQWRWVRETFASDPEEQRRLYENLLTKAIDRMVTAKWGRDWSTYWEWYEWLVEKWPADIPRPKVLSERIFPPIVYKFKDILDHVVNMVRR